MLTLIGFPAIGYLIHSLTMDRPFLDIFVTRSSYWFELLLGAAAGLCFGLIGSKIVSMDFMKDIRMRYARLFAPLKLTVPDIVFISLCAGVGEEILFRGVIQPHLGIWFTAILFVAIHGYLNPLSWRMSVYGTFMTLAIAVIGTMSQKYGLTSAMTAHFVIDIVLFLRISKDGIGLIEDNRPGSDGSVTESDPDEVDP